MMAAKISRDPSIPLAGNSAGSSPRRPPDARHHPQISPTRLFFKAGIDAAVPSVLRRGIGARQHATGPLHRKSPAVKQLAHMPRMILNPELLLDHPGNHGRRPDAAVQTVSYRTTVENVAQLLLLLFCQFRRPT